MTALAPSASVCAAAAAGPLPPRLPVSTSAADARLALVEQQLAAAEAAREAAHRELLAALQRADGLAADAARAGALAARLAEAEVRWGLPWVGGAGAAHAQVVSCGGPWPEPPALAPPTPPLRVFRFSPPARQGRLGLMLELLGERNERIEQLEADVKVGGCGVGGRGASAGKRGRRASRRVQEEGDGRVGAGSAVGPGGERRQAGQPASRALAHQPRNPGCPQDMKAIFHQQLSLAADQLFEARQRLEAQQQRQQRRQQAGAG